METMMKRTQLGDKVAYADLLQQSRILIEKHLCTKLNRREDVQKVLQEVLISIHKARHTYNTDRPFKPWLFSLIDFRLNNFLKRSNRKRFNNISFSVNPKLI